MIGDLTFAFLAGAVATANPCGFALLPAYLARRLGAEDGGGPDTSARIARALAVGAVTTLGFLAVFVLVGGGVAAGLTWLAATAPWVGLAMGLVLAAAGAAVAAGRRLRLQIPGPRLPATAGDLTADLLFGVGYGAASLSCTFPVFLAVLGAATLGDVPAGAMNVLAYALGMGAVLTALAVAAALSRAGLAAGISRLLPYMNRVSGVLLLLAGLYVTVYWAYALFAPLSAGDNGLIVAGERVSGQVRAWIAAPSGRTALLAVLALLGGWSLWMGARHVFRQAVRRRS